jgi:hypothetical protein
MQNTSLKHLHYSAIAAILRGNEKPKPKPKPTMSQPENCTNCSQPWHDHTGTYCKSCGQEKPNPGRTVNFYSVIYYGGGNTSTNSHPTEAGALTFAEAAAADKGLGACRTVIVMGVSTYRGGQESRTIATLPGTDSYDLDE